MQAEKGLEKMGILDRGFEKNKKPTVLAGCIFKMKWCQWRMADMNMSDFGICDWVISFDAFVLRRG